MEARASDIRTATATSAQRSDDARRTANAMESFFQALICNALPIAPIAVAADRGGSEDEAFGAAFRSQEKKEDAKGAETRASSWIQSSSLTRMLPDKFVAMSEEGLPIGSAARAIDATIVSTAEIKPVVSGASRAMTSADKETEAGAPDPAALMSPPEGNGGSTKNFERPAVPPVGLETAKAWEEMKAARANGAVIERGLKDVGIDKPLLHAHVTWKAETEEAGHARFEDAHIVPLADAPDATADEGDGAAKNDGTTSNQQKEGGSSARIAAHIGAPGGAWLPAEHGQIAMREAMSRDHAEAPRQSIDRQLFDPTSLKRSAQEKFSFVMQAATIGDVDVEISIRDGKAHVEIAAAPDAAREINRDHGALERNIRASTGLNVEVSVVANGDGARLNGMNDAGGDRAGSSQEMTFGSNGRERESGAKGGGGHGAGETNAGGNVERAMDRSRGSGGKLIL
ncbi:MAG: hypothetical protein ACK5JM_03655 [Rhodoblastus sp.]